MSIRREPTYLSTEVWRALWLISKSRSPAGEGDLSRIVTADEMADELLRAVIKEQFPEVWEHQRNLEKLDRELIKKLLGKT